MKGLWSDRNNGFTEDLRYSRMGGIETVMRMEIQRLSWDGYVVWMDENNSVMNV